MPVLQRFNLEAIHLAPGEPALADGGVELPGDLRPGLLEFRGVHLAVPGVGPVIGRLLGSVS